MSTTLRPTIVAHRGASAIAAENTLYAIDAAIAAGADLAEVDVRLSSDGLPVCCHDPDLARTTASSGAVDRFTADELSAAGVPPLARVLDFARGRLPILLDCKLDGEPFWRVLLAAIERAGLSGEDVVIGVRSVSAVMILSEQPRFRVLGFMPHPSHNEAFAAAGGHILRLWECDLTADLVTRTRELGLPWWVTCGAPGHGNAGDATIESLAAIMAFEPDGLLVNDPSLAIAALDRRARPA